MDAIWGLCPLGHRFVPTDEELINDYLSPRSNNEVIPQGIIKELNIYDYEPYQLSSMGFIHDDKMYFFSPISRKHKGGSRINRLTKSGYWRASQSVSSVLNEDGEVIGRKRPLVYYYYNPNGEGTKTQWLMNEFSLNRSHNLVLCQIHYKNRKGHHGGGYFPTPNPNQHTTLQPNQDFSTPCMGVALSSNLNDQDITLPKDDDAITNAHMNISCPPEDSTPLKNVADDTSTSNPNISKTSQDDALLMDDSLLSIDDDLPMDDALWMDDAMPMDDYVLGLLKNPRFM